MAHPFVWKGNKFSGLVVPPPMQHVSVTIPARGVDWKGLGYIISIVSVFFLGAIAWPKPGEPEWHMPVLIVGMATSIVGMGFRYLSHLKMQKELRRTEAEAREANGRTR
jgi:hypothetical protein